MLLGFCKDLTLSKNFDSSSTVNEANTLFDNDVTSASFNDKELTSLKLINKKKRQENAILPFSEYRKYVNSENNDTKLNDQDGNNSETELISRIIYLPPFHSANSSHISTSSNNKRIVEDQESESLFM